MRDIFIFGSGGFAKEIAHLIKDINLSKERDENYNIAGFIDTAPQINTLTIGKNQFPIFDEKTFFETTGHDNASFTIGIGDPQIREKIFNLLESKFDFPNLVHPSVTGDFESIILGKGNIIAAGCCFTVDISIASSNVFNLNVTVGHDCIIKSNNVINPGANISGSVTINNSNLIGTGATILQGLSVGSHSIIGAGSVVTKDIASHVLAVGIPAKSIKELHHTKKD
ncbi:MAG: acetyltransferase [Halobacteriovoraceae bacterium]|jgi:sugar O-acyltransferase (sialic acid O-acetyltransferase NeuD family)|nr:acetyltransferase [Halobacteriovoraceae bacterium]